MAVPRLQVRSAPLAGREPLTPPALLYPEHLGTATSAVANGPMATDRVCKVADRATSSALLLPLAAGPEEKRRRLARRRRRD
jgi:hypothetical protein